MTRLLVVVLLVEAPVLLVFAALVVLIIKFVFLFVFVLFVDVVLTFGTVALVVFALLGVLQNGTVIRNVMGFKSNACLPWRLCRPLRLHGVRRNGRVRRGVFSCVHLRRDNAPCVPLYRGVRAPL